MSNNNNNSSTSSGIGITGLLGIAFVVLKLTGYIDWSWWWVTSPFWLPLATGLTVLAVWFLILLIPRRRKK